MKIPEKRNKIKERSIICSHIWHNDISKNYTTVTFKPNEDYSRLTAISVIDQLLDINAVYSLIDEASKKTPNLSHLNLGYNQVKGQFDIGKLQSFKKMDYFFIPNNTINRFINTATEDMPTVRHIDLGGNKIRFVDFEIFERFPNVGRIVLSYNKVIGTIDMVNFQPMKKMSRIDLDNNKMTNIANTGIEEMPKLVQITLTNNKLTSLDLNIFSIFVNLKMLYLDGNMLTTIDGYPKAKTILPRIQYITINRNEFKCDYLRKITEPYDWPGFWYEAQDSEDDCSEPKSEIYMFRTCCYP